MPIRKLRLLTCLVGCVFLYGCPGAPAPVIPGEVAAAVDNKVSLVDREDSPLANVAAGTPIDDLEKLEGCWGRLRSGDVDGSGELDLFLVYHFDLVSSIWDIYIYSQRPDGSPVDLITFSYRFHIVDAGAIRPFALLGGFAYEWDTAVWIPILPQIIAVTEIVPLTVHGSQLKLGEQPMAGGGTDENSEPLILTRYNCN